jgi:hypothetical protein
MNPVIYTYVIITCYCTMLLLSTIACIKLRLAMSRKKGRK